MNAAGNPQANESDPDLAAALEEYLDHLDSKGRSALYARLQRSPSFRERMTGAIADMAMLIAAAHTIENEEEFEQVAERAFEECLLDPAEIRDLRLYYLDNLDSIDFPASMARLAYDGVRTRMARQRAHYLILHNLNDSFG